jgi:alanine dehydrogenase
MLKIGLIREGKQPIDRRVPITPTQAKYIKEHYPELDIVAQASSIRSFVDKEYEDQGIEVRKEIADCDVLMGVKEVPLYELIPKKTYFFFSHTIKKQPFNRKLLQTILQKNIRLVDYEKLTNSRGERVVAFGRWAGIVGAYNALWTWGRRYGTFDLKRANQCFDYEDLKKEYSKISLPPIKIVVTGGGRVAKGALEVLHDMNIHQVSPEDILRKEYNEPVFAQLNSRHYNKRRAGGGFEAQEFYRQPEQYDSDFTKYSRIADMLIACAYWSPGAPVLFSKEQIAQAEFTIKVIADVTCDIDGSIPSTIKASTISEPIYDYNPITHSVETPLSHDRNITVMAIDNLPCELPRDASQAFGRDLLEHVIPYLATSDSDEMLKRATIAENGKLTQDYAYLQGYVEGKE